MTKSAAEVEVHGKATLIIGALTLGAVVMLAGCETPPEQELPPPDQDPTELTDETSRCGDLSERELEKQAIELLDQGESGEARQLLDCVLGTNPGARRASSLVRQLDADPIAYLGRRHYLYTVQSSETLSKIAGERLGDPLEFVILARYNAIPVPANLAAGQRIKIPGEESASVSPDGTVADDPPDQADDGEKTAPPAGDPAPDAATEQVYREAIDLEQRGDFETAFGLLQRVKATDPERSGIDDDLNRVLRSLVAQLEERAYELELAGEIAQAVQTWQKLLEFDPRNIPAQLSLKRLEQ